MREIPSINDLKDALENDLKSKLNLSTTDLKYVLDAMDGVLAMQFKLVYLYLSDIQNNIFPDTADLEENGGTLERLGRIYLNRNPRPATPGIFNLRVTGVNGSVLRSGLTFKSNENSLNPSKLYILDNQVVFNGTNEIIEVRSLGGGSEFNLNINDVLTITEPVLGVDNLAIVDTVIQQPISSENIEVYRQNILDSIQLEPQGGSKTDYRLWSSDAQGVRKVYPYVRNDDAGFVDVFVEANASDSNDGFGTPSTALLNEVLEVINFDPDDTKPLNERGRKPIQANVVALKIEIQPIDITVNGLVDSSPSVQSAIRQNLEKFLFDVRPYVAGADLQRDKNDILYSARLQSIITSVLDSSNFFNSLKMEINGVEYLSYEFNLGFIPYLRNLNFS